MRHRNVGPRRGELAQRGGNIRLRRGLGELTEDLLSDRALRSPLFGPDMRDGGDPTVIGPNADGSAPGSAWRNPYRFMSYGFISTAVQVERLMAANFRRAYLLIQNRSGAAVFIGFGSGPNNASGYELAGGGSLEMGGGGPGGAFCASEDIYILPTAVGQIVVAGEGYYIPPG